MLTGDMRENVEIAVIHLYCGTDEHNGEKFEEVYYYPSVDHALVCALEVHGQTDKDFTIRAHSWLVSHLSSLVNEGYLKITDPIDGSYSLVGKGNMERDKEYIKNIFNLACDLEEIGLYWEWSEMSQEFICHLRDQHKSD